MKHVTSPIRSGLLIAALCWGSGFAAIDSFDSTIVRTILDKIGWNDVAVGSVVSSSVLTVSSLLPVRVTTLNLSARSGLTPITELPSEISQLPELVTLSLRGNALTGLPSTLSTLFKLTRLDLSSNSLTQLPDALKGLPLQVLTVNHNPIRSIPDWIDTLSKLQSASFTADSLTTLPATLAGLTGLTTLNLDSNLIDSLPPELTELKDLKVSVNGNRLCSIDSSTGRWLDDCQLGTDWRAAQLCGSKIASIVAEAATGTVVLVTADAQKTSADCLPVQLTAVAASSFDWFDRQQIVKAVAVRFNDCFTAAENYFLVSFSWKDVRDAVAAGSNLAIYYARDNASEYLGGAIDSVNETIAVRATREGDYLLTVKLPTAVRRNGPAAGIPAHPVRFAFHHRLLETSFTLERPSDVRLRLFALDGRFIAGLTAWAGAGTHTLRFDRNAARCGRQFIAELRTGEFNVKRILQNF